jgi:hypothetical protein
MTSNIQPAETIEQVDNRRTSLIMWGYNRLFGITRRRARRRLTLDQLLLNAFGSISPAYLF